MEANTLRNVLFSNNILEICEEEKKVYINVKSKGYDLASFQKLLSDFPRIKITQFIALRAAIENALGQFIQFGELKPLVEISVSNDSLKAYAYINLTPSQYQDYNKKDLVEQILLECQTQGIVYGIHIDEIIKNLRPQEKFVVANGLLPTHGKNAKVKLYELEELKPQVFEDGKVNYYELNLINKVNRGDWVGERIEPTLGEPGKNVFGEIIPAIPGRQVKLVYDHKTILESLNEDKTITTLTAKKTGAVVYENSVLTVCNCLEIEGKVSFETGNIDFDGYVEVRDSIEDNFSVRADNDIQVMGRLGVGGVDTIESRDGNIYIRGGIAGKNKAKIICDGNLYTKFASDCIIECKGSVNIGYYALNADIKAKEVILEAYNSRIIGGKIDAQIRVVAGEIGSHAEVPTYINVKGFNRSLLKEEYDALSDDIANLKDQIEYITQKLAVFDLNRLDNRQKQLYVDLEQALDNSNRRLKALYEQKKRYTSYLHSRGDGEIRANKCIHPQVHLTINHFDEHIKNTIWVPTTYFVHNGELKKD